MIATAEARQDVRKDLEQKIENTVRGIFSEFERAGIPAVITRNVHYIPSLIVDRGDIDIAIPNGISEAQLINLVGSYGLIHWVWKQKNVHAYFKITGSYILRIDFQHGVNQWLGSEYFKESRVFSGAQLENGFPVADENTQVMLKWLPSILTTAFYKDRYSDDIVTAARKDPDGFRELLTYALGNDLGEKYWKWAIDGTPERSADHVRETRKAVRGAALRRAPVRTVVGFLDYFRLEILLRLKIRPGGISMALIGPDGSGKTTLCGRLVDAPYQRLPFRDKNHRRFIFPGLSRLLRKGKERAFGSEGEVYTGPHAKKPHSLPVGMVRMAYTVLRFWITEFSWVRHEIAKNVLVVYDRHLLDACVDPMRFRFKGPGWVSRWTGKLAPQPELIILLDAPAEIVHPRKQEVPIEETDRQRRAYQDLVHGMDNAFVVDATQPVDVLVDEVNHIVNEFMAGRAHERIQMLRGRTTEAPETALA